MTAYAFNSDRSKAEVYTKNEMDKVKLWGTDPEDVTTGTESLNQTLAENGKTLSASPSDFDEIEIYARFGNGNGKGRFFRIPNTGGTVDFSKADYSEQSDTKTYKLVNSSAVVAFTESNNTNVIYLVKSSSVQHTFSRTINEETQEWEEDMSAGPAYENVSIYAVYGIKL